MARTIRARRFDEDTNRERHADVDDGAARSQRRRYRAAERQRLREAVRDGGDTLTDHYARPWRVDPYSLPSW